MHKKPDWLSSDEQQTWFNRFTIKNNTNHCIGIDLEQFKKFLRDSLYPYLNSIISNYQQNSRSRIGNSEQIIYNPEQELQLFKRFDLKNNHMIDQDEFAGLCRNWLFKVYNSRSALVVVDVQNDFIDGSLALIKSPYGQDGAEVVPIINSLIDREVFDTLVYSQDWHPVDHIGFYDNLHLRKYTLKTNKFHEHNHKVESKNDLVSSTGAIHINNNSDFCKLKKLSTEAKLFDTVLFEEGKIEQLLWPRHCVQGSWGADFHPELKVRPNAIFIKKGTDSNNDAYSVFWDNMHLNETNLRHELTTRGITDVFFCGIALDYCVASSALDALKAGFSSFVIEDACRGVSKDTSEIRRKEMIEKGVLIINTASACEYLSATRDDFNKRHEGQQVSDMVSDIQLIHSNRNESSMSNNGSSNTRSHDIRDIVVDISYKKAFL